MNKVTTRFLKASIIIIGMVVLALSVFALPALAEYTVDMYPEFASLKYPVLIGLYMTCVPFMYALYQALRLLGLIESNRAFSTRTVRVLQHIKYCTAMVIVLYAVGAVFLAVQSALHPGIAIIGGVIVFATMVMTLFTTVFQELLSNALQIKYENDLTV